MTDRELLKISREHALGLVDKVDHYPYHNADHTLDVYARAAYLADCEGVSSEEKTDLLLSALFHDTGFSIAYSQNETIGADIAERFLRGTGLSEERIVRIRRIILATVVYSVPGDLLEKIIQDADLDNLGREDCFVNMERVGLELRTIATPPVERDRWLEFSEQLLSKFSFNTATAKREREEKRMSNLQSFYLRYR